MTTGRFLCFSMEKIKKNRKKKEKACLRSQKIEGNGLQFTNNA